MIANIIVAGAGLQANLAGLSLTVANADLSTNGDLRDSDGALNATMMES